MVGLHWYTNTITIVAEDAAGNMGSDTLTWIADDGNDHTPPAITWIDLQPDASGSIVLPDMPEVWALPISR